MLRHFEAGIVETFEVTLENVPHELIADNYFQKGEFIISEVADYEIPELSTTYQTLGASIKEKCLPVIVTNPNGTETAYVGIDGGGKVPPTFTQILSRLYDKNVKVENDRLTQVGEFQNNLPSFTHLKEVKEQDKTGKWFVMTKALHTSYLDHKFTPSDVIVLSYVTGVELGSVSLEKIYSFEGNVASHDSPTSMILGEAGDNASLEFQIAPLKRTGEEMPHD